MWRHVTPADKALQGTRNSPVQLAAVAFWRHTLEARSEPVSAVAGRLTPIRWAAGRMIEAHEIKDGLVLHLDPDELEAEGGACAGTDSARVQGPHFFVCIASNEHSGNWVPLFSAAGPRRAFLPHEEKEGHAIWCESTTYFHLQQVWQAPHSAVVAAAIAGGDLSRPGERNKLTEAGVDSVYKAVFPESAA